MLLKALLYVTFTPSFYCFAQFSACYNFGELVECKPHTKLAITMYLIMVDVDSPDNLASPFLDI